MRNRKAPICAIIILLAILAAFIYANTVVLYYPAFLSVLIGGACMLLYFDKKKVWALLLGILIIISGFSGFLLQIPDIGDNILKAFLLTASGIVIYFGYYKKGKEWLLTPSCFLVGTGIFSIFICFACIRQIAGAFLFFCLGLSFLGAYFLKKKKKKVWPIFMGLFFFIISGIFMLGNFSTENGFQHLFYFLPFIFILGSIVYLVFFMKKGDRY